MARNPRINIVVDPEVFTALKLLAEEDSRSVSQYVSLVLTKHCFENVTAIQMSAARRKARKK